MEQLHLQEVLQTVVVAVTTEAVVVGVMVIIEGVEVATLRIEVVVVGGTVRMVVIREEKMEDTARFLHHPMMGLVEVIPCLKILMVGILIMTWKQFPLQQVILVVLHLIFHPMVAVVVTVVRVVVKLVVVAGVVHLVLTMVAMVVVLDNRAVVMVVVLDSRAVVMVVLLLILL